MLKKVIHWMIASIAVSLSANDALAWGSAGHSAAAEIAQRYSGSQTRKRIAELVGSVSLASLSSWADTYAVLHPSSRPWHYVNIPLDATSFDRARDCPGEAFGDCIIGAIEHFRQILADGREPREARAVALKMLVHLVVDLHQPMHSADRDGDAGGSKLMVEYFGAPMSLHNVWDFGILDHHSYDWGAHVERARATLDDATVLRLREGSITDWAMETHGLARTVAYDLPADNKIGEDYNARALSVVHRQIAAAGIRLAWLLRRTLVDGR